MTEARVVKLVEDDSYQCLVLPREFWFNGVKVYTTRDEITGDVRLSERADRNVWEAFCALVPAIKDPSDFMVERQLSMLQKMRG